MVQQQKLDELIGQLEVPTNEMDRVLELDTERIGNICKALAHHSTAYTLVKPQAKGNALDDTILKIEEYSSKLVSMVGNGSTALEKEFNSQVQRLVTLLRELITDDTDLKSRVGKVWQLCEELQDTPKTNCVFVYKRLIDISEMLSDAESDVQEMIQGIDFEGDQMDVSDNDKLFVCECKALIKTAILLNKRMMYLLKNVKEMNEFWFVFSESCLRMGYNLSEKADNLCCLLDLPVDRNEELLESIKDLSKECQDCIELIKRGESNTKWTDLCEQQLSKLLGNLSVE